MHSAPVYMKSCCANGVIILASHKVVQPAATRVSFRLAREP